MLTKDLARWLDAAQSAPFTKNKVRKDLWSNFTECIRYSLPHQQPGLYTRIPRAHFITLQSFCMIDGKGGDKLNNDELLSFITTLDILRSACSLSLADFEDAEEDDDEEQRSHTPKPLITKKRSGSV